jgi:hypothetical protein
VRRRREQGTALVEVTWLGILLLLPMVWIVLSVFEVQRGAFAVTASARSAARTFALARDDATGRQRAEHAASVALSDQGLRDSPWSLAIDCADRPDCHAGGVVVTVRVSTHVALPFVPDVLGGRAGFALDAVSRVPIGQYQDPG